MSSAFIYPSITSLPAGYDCTISIPLAQLIRRMTRSGTVRCVIRVFHNGVLMHTEEHRIEVRDRKAVGKLPQFYWVDHTNEWSGEPGFLEISMRADDGEPIFRDASVIGFYAIYSKAGKKSFFSDNAYRYGAPPIINQIAAFGRYVDTYPVVHLDRRRDLGETLALINPYAKPVRAKIITQDGRELRGRVESNCVLNIRLTELLREDEDEWLGQIQLTATNRLVTFHLKHSMTDPQIISDHEHLDPFRSDETHYPLAQILRLKAGNVLKRYPGLAGFLSSRGIVDLR